MISTAVAKNFLTLNSNYHIKSLFVGGEQLGQIKFNNTIDVYDSYGPCECLSFVSYINILNKIDTSSVGNLNINTKCYVLDIACRRVPVGAVGELYLSGYQLAKGYLNREGETKEAFLDNPFDGNKSGYEKMYKTGDMVRVLPDGTLGFIGRKDSQVKIRGNRIELGEVESCIREIDIVKDTTVISINNNNTKELVAYVVLNDNNNNKNNENITEQIRKHISVNKPSYMVPSFIEIIDSIPLNINGKVDKRALPEVNRISNQDIIVMPSNRLEHVIHESICSVLGIDRNCLGVDTNLIHCGLDSLSSIKIVFLMKEKYNINLSATDLLQNITIKRIAKKCNNSTRHLLYAYYTNRRNKNLVFVNPGMGGSESYFEFSKFLQGRISFSCIENYNFNHLDDRVRGYKNVAKLYVDILKEHQPEGPYYLGGWSLGGNIAYEMACILKSQGDLVKNVYMLDSVYQKNLLNQEEKEIYAKISSEKMFKTNKSIEAMKGLPNNLISLYKEALFDQIIDSLDYVPSNYDDGVLMLKATVQSQSEEIYAEIPASILNKMNDSSSTDNGYKDFAKKIKIIEIPFSHEHLMDYEPAKIISKIILDDMLSSTLSDN